MDVIKIVAVSAVSMTVVSWCVTFESIYSPGKWLSVDIEDVNQNKLDLVNPPMRLGDDNQKSLY